MFQTVFVSVPTCASTISSRSLHGVITIDTSGDDQRNGKCHDPKARLHTIQHRGRVLRGRAGRCSGDLRGFARHRKVIRVCPAHSASRRLFLRHACKSLPALSSRAFGFAMNSSLACKCRQLGVQYSQCFWTKCSSQKRRAPVRTVLCSRLNEYSQRARSIPEGV